MKITRSGEQLTFHLEGVCDYQTFKKIKTPNLKQIKKVVLDCQKLEKIDFSFVLYLSEWLKSYKLPYEFLGQHQDLQEMFDLVNQRQQSEEKKARFSFDPLFRLGKRIWQSWNGVLNFLNFFGLLLVHLFYTILNPRSIRFSSLMFHINHSGFKALPVGLATCAIVSAAISLQGVLQLQKMGVPLVSVETMAKLALREMGPFILALVIAGRSSSSFTAQIGVMRITEELDAMKTMGFDWFRFIVLPRLLALVIAMPLLVFVADAFSLFASASMIRLQTGITYSQYIERFYEFVDLSHMWVGVIKAPFFGAAIAIVGCYHGFQIRGDTQSVGKYTTISVVNALFWIIMINAIFSIIFTRLDI